MPSRIWNCGAERESYCEVTIADTMTNKGPGLMVSSSIFDQDDRIDMDVHGESSFFLDLFEAINAFERRVQNLEALGKEGLRGQYAMLRRQELWAVRRS